MKQSVRRILMAAIVSGAVYGSTWYWYQNSKSGGEQNNNAKAIAYVGTVQNDVRRRPSTRLIWQSLTSGDPLYAGEAIRTSNKGQIRIQFPDNNRYIDLDPDSLIVINSAANEIALDLMDGSLMVAGDKDQATAGPALTLNSTKGKVDLSKSFASLSKSSTGGVDVMVHSGKATGANGQSVDDQGDEDLQVLTPSSDKPMVMNPENMEPIRFTWKPNTGGVKWKSISLWLGSSLKDLQPAGEVPGNNTSFEKKIPVGRHFFKLIAVDDKGNAIAQSHIRRFELAAKHPPGVLAPLDGAHLIAAKADHNVTFKWTKPNGGKEVHLELSKDSKFKDVLLNKDFSDDESYTDSLATGTYFWRLSTHYEGVDKALATKTLHFSVSAKAKVDVVINWKPTPPIEHYIEKINMNLAWESPQKDQVKNWKLHIWPDVQGREPSADKEIVIETAKLEASHDVPAAGKYHARLEAFDENELLLAKSEVKDIEMAPLPLLSAPEFQPKDGKLQANNHGTLDLLWTSLADAKAYHLTLLDKDGKEIKSADFKKNQTSLVNLLPGDYLVDVYALDNHGRQSEHGKPRAVTVPDSSGLHAPKLKKVQVH